MLEEKTQVTEKKKQIGWRRGGKTEKQMKWQRKSKRCEMDNMYITSLDIEESDEWEQEMESKVTRNRQGKW